ncbi:MAG: 23S rRNA (guanosine(2251)-2'-O)-methyltransferase RlmB [Desulfamplus sp.]|nr:23S rRNA (guanosine(2251)-2'-O)-methyltransferase RlmB [Desulfamplus sp.]
MSYEILCGIHSVLEALKAKRRSFEKIYISKDRSLSRIDEIIELAKNYKNRDKNRVGATQSNKTENIDIEFASAAHLDNLSNGVKHQGVAAKVSMFPVKKAEDELKNWEFLDHLTAYNKKFIVVVEGVEDTHNLGAIIRTAICAGVDHIVIPKDRATQPSSAISRISAGAMEHADIHIVTNTALYLKNLKKKGIWVAGLDADGETSLFSSDLTDNIALVVGGEHQGIRPVVKKECDFLLSLPLAEFVEADSPPSPSFSKKIITSLNASVACGIAMYEVVRQRGCLNFIPNS